MALFSFRHTVKTFSLKREKNAREAFVGQTAAHLRYIARPKAARTVIRERVCSERNIEVAKAAEDEAQRKKGRVCERFRVALPVEASEAQRVALVRAFGDALTEGLAGYIAAIHDQHGNDAANPHFHMVAFDHYQKSGGRGRPRSTLGMARKNAVERTAKIWADTHNQLMKSWGFGDDSMIDHRSFKDRGIDRIPQIHEGPGARAMADKGQKPTMKEEWANIDAGHTRAEANKIIREINAIKEVEHDDERPDRLGVRDDGRTEKHGGSRENDRARSVSDGRGDRNAAPPFAGAGQAGNSPAGDQGGARQPPFLTLGPTETEGRARRKETVLPPFLAWSRLRRRRGVRRIYRELVMLRDTLRARLARRSSQKSAAPAAHEIRAMERPRNGPVQQQR